MAKVSPTENQKEEKVSNTVPAERSNTDMSSNKSKVSPATHARHARMSLAGRDNFADRQKRKEKHMKEQEGDGGVAKVYLHGKGDLYRNYGNLLRPLWWWYSFITGKSADGAFDALNVISLFVFLFELAVTYAADPKYRFSFYFWVDFVAIITMVPDITFMWEPILDAFAGQAGGGTSSSADSVTSASLSGAKSAKVVRIIRIVRLTRLVRLVKLWKSYGGGDVEIEEVEMNEEPSNVGTKLNEKTMRKVIIIVLAMLILTPFFEYSFYRPVENEFKKYGLTYLYDLANSDDLTISQDDFSASRQATSMARWLRVWQHSSLRHDEQVFLGQWYSGAANKKRVRNPRS